MSTSMPTNSTPSLTEEYIATLTEKEYQGYMIARSHLGSSFDLEKSLGFIEWKKTQKEPSAILSTNEQSTILVASSSPYNP